MAKQGRERIITAAFQLFLEKGYKGVSLKDITTATQLSKGAVYHHFESKHAIYLAAIEEYFFKALEMDFPKDENQSLKQRIRRRYEQFIGIIDFVENSGKGIDFPIRTYFIFQLESEHNPDILEKVKISMDEYRQEITQLVQTAKDRNEISIELSATIIAQQIMSMIEGIAIHHSALKDNSRIFLTKKYKEVIESYLDLILKIN